MAVALDRYLRVVRRQLLGHLKRCVRGAVVNDQHAEFGRQLASHFQKLGDAFL